MHLRKNHKSVAQQFKEYRAKVKILMSQTNHLPQNSQRPNPLQKSPNSGPQPSWRCKKPKKSGKRTSGYWRIYKELQKAKKKLLLARSVPPISVPGTSQHLNNVVPAVDTQSIFRSRPEEHHSLFTETGNKNFVAAVNTQNIFPFKPEEPRSTQNIFPLKTEEPRPTQNIFTLRPEEPSSIVTEIENKNLEPVDAENMAHFSQEDSHSDGEMENEIEPRLSEDNVQVDLPPGISEDSLVEYDTFVKVSFGVQTDNTVVTVTKEQQTDSDSAVENKQHKTNDECQIFGDFIASELRNIKFDEDRRKLRRIILRDIVTVSESEQRMD